MAEKEVEEKTQEQVLDPEKLTAEEIDENAEKAGYVPMVFIGRPGLGEREGIFMPTIHKFWIPVDKDGEIMDPTDSDGNYKDPTTHPDFLIRKMYELYRGEVAMIPGPKLDEASYRAAVNSRRFAKVKHLKEIKKMYKQGKTYSEIRAYLTEQKGFVGVPDKSVKKKKGG